MSPETLVGYAMMAVPILLSLTLHEYGHARVAMAFGDHTARLMGRVTLNPLAHLDPLGTICLFFGPIGWAKPVPVNPMNLQPKRLGDVCVSLAGVGMNLLLVGVAVGGIHLMAAAGVTIDVSSRGPVTPGGVGVFLLTILMGVNTGLIVFNLIPLYPLDGHHVLREMIGPWRMQDKFMEFQLRYGQLILLVLIGVPWLLQRTRHAGAFNPLGWLFFQVRQAEWDYLFTDRAADLALTSLIRYSHLLPWMR